MKLNGLIAATYTPFAPDGAINLDLIPAMIEHMIERGVSGFYVCGSTGEGESLTIEERKAVAEVSVSAADGRLPVVVQVGHNSLSAACELARHASVCGADAISSLPPTYFKPTSLDILIECLAEIAASAPDLPYYYYHIPRLSGVRFDMPTLLEKVDPLITNFAGIKFSDFFLAEMGACQAVSGGKFDILFGSDEMILGALAMGATGAVGSCYGFAAPLWNQIIEAHHDGDAERANALMRKAISLVRLLDRQPGPFHAAVRQVIWPLLGFDLGPVRLPQSQLSEVNCQEVRQQLEQSGFSEAIKLGKFVA